MSHGRGLWLCVLLMCGSLANAQGKSPTAHLVTGTVFDSITGAPLAGAIVQAVRPESAARVFSATSDAAGQYRLVGLPRGKFAIGFQHNALVALGIESPMTAFELGADSAITVDLAIPSGEAVRLERCGKASQDSTEGMLAGFVMDAARESGLPKASIVVEWLEIVRANGKDNGAKKRVTATVSDDGSYLVCGIPGDAWVDIRASHPGHRVISGPVAVPNGGASRLDFRLTDSVVAKGTSSLMGRVLRIDRSRLANGRASIAALGIDVPVRDGEFTMSGVPAGTWTVDARAIGYEPHSVLAQFTDQVTSTAEITITQKTQTLEAVNVIGKVGRDIKILDAIVERNRVSNGTMFMPGNEFLKGATYPVDILRAAKGFTYLNEQAAKARGCAPGDTLSDANEGRARKSGQKKYLTVYIDGTRYPAGLKGLNDMIPMNQVLAIETYPDVVSAPLMWRRDDTCAIIAVWTKR